jgi:hypothetical protein
MSAGLHVDRRARVAVFVVVHGSHCPVKSKSPET